MRLILVQFLQLLSVQKPVKSVHFPVLQLVSLYSVQDAW
jgi:hypothetical protein